MASLLTNATALSALQTLSQTQKDLATTQNRISSGLRVAEAADNAVYWSIATTMKSDNNAMSAVKDSLNLGASTVDVATAALNSSIGVLNQLKTDLVAAAQPGADRAKIQLDISQLQKQLKSISDSASFNGQNWLSQDSAGANYNATKGIVASFSRDSAGAVSVGTIDIDTASVKLYDAAGNASRTLVQEVQNKASAYKIDAGLIINVRNAAATLQVSTATAGNTANRVAMDAAITALGALDTSSAVRNAYTAYAAAVDDTAATTDDATALTAFNTAIQNLSTSLASSSGTALQTAVTNAASAGLDATISGKFTTYNTTFATYTGTSYNTTAKAAFEAQVTTIATAGAAKSGVLDSISSTTGFSIASMDITALTDSAADVTKLSNLTKQVDNALKSITNAASTLGATKTRINLQSTFVSSLQEAITKGIGSLVDADMNEESTRLQALQVQQQLGVQSLGIANQNSMLILKLFGG
jgi:flagellin